MSGLAHGGDLTGRIIGLAMQVHRHLGPGLLEQVYHQCLCFELSGADIPFDQQVPLHEAQLLTYLRISSCRIGLLINFNTASLTEGIRRRVL